VVRLDATCIMIDLTQSSEEDNEKLGSKSGIAWLTPHFLGISNLN